MKRAAWSAEPSTLADVPTMVSREEQRYLHWLGRTQWRDEGHVVEIGPWLGGSTVCLAAGMRAGRSRARHKLHAFDNFVWREFMARFVPLPLAPGESFEPWYRANVAAFADLVETHKLTLPDETIEGDKLSAGSRGSSAPALEPFRWSGENIEILFVDGAKSWRGMRWLLACVAESLIPGRTLLVAQDFKHWGSSWVPLMLARLQPALELVHVVERGSTATFRLREALDAQRFLDLEDHVARLDLQASLADLERMADWIESTGDHVGACHVRLGEVQLYSHHGGLPEAAARFEELRAAWPLRGARGQLENAQRYLGERGVTLARANPWRRLRGLLAGPRARPL